MSNNNTKLASLAQNIVVAGGGVFEPIRSVSTNYTFVLGDAVTTVLHPVADTADRTWTIPTNASTAFDIGTILTVVNQAGAGNVIITITTDTLRVAGLPTTGSINIAQNGYCTITKITATEWQLTGAGIGSNVGNGVFIENKTTLTANTTISTGSNALMVGPLIVPSGITLTIPSGSRVVVL